MYKHVNRAPRTRVSDGEVLRQGPGSATLDCTQDKWVPAAPGPTSGSTRVDIPPILDCHLSIRKLLGQTSSTEGFEVTSLQRSMSVLELSGL